MNTGYFACARKYEGKGRMVSIALYPPHNWKGSTYPPLYPSPSLLSDFKAGIIDEEKYKERYIRQLESIGAQKIWSDLGSDAILICYEGPNSFCHRHIVAEWLMSKLGVHIFELPNKSLPGRFDP